MSHADFIALSQLLVEMRVSGVPRLRAMLDAKELLGVSVRDVSDAMDHADKVLAKHN